MRTTSRTAKAIDNQISSIYRQHCAGIQINVLDIGKVFSAGHAAHAAGQDMTAAIVATVQQLRQN